MQNQELIQCGMLGQASVMHNNIPNRKRTATGWPSQ